MFRNTFAVFDANKDGFIDFKEFILALALSEANDVDSKLEAFFKMLIRWSVLIDDNHLFLSVD